MKTGVQLAPDFKLIPDVSSLRAGRLAVTPDYHIKKSAIYIQ